MGEVDEEIEVADDEIVGGTDIVVFGETRCSVGEMVTW